MSGGLGSFEGPGDGVEHILLDGIDPAVGLDFTEQSPVAVEGHQGFGGLAIDREPVLDDLEGVILASTTEQTAGEDVVGSREV